MDTPAQNGHAERAGRTLITVARAIRVYAGLPSNLWSETVRTAGYLLNRLPTRGLGWRTPYQVLLGKKPDLSHLFIIGCKAYSLNHGIPRKDKLAPRASIGYLVGYDSTNIYRIWDPARGVVFRTRDVTFDELTLYSGRGVAPVLVDEPTMIPEIVEQPSQDR